MKNVPQKYSESDPIFDLMSLDWPFGTFRVPMHTHTPLSSSDISVWEENKHVVVQVAVPGVKSDDVEITVEKGVLLVRANKKEEKTDKDKKYYQKSSSSFVYRVAIPNEIDESQEPKATLKDGLLEIHFKKSDRSIPKKIPVQHS